jgi:aryl carrier-like protein
MDTYNIYMDELPAGEEIDGEEMVEVEFRVVPGTDDETDSENNAVIAGLDLVDLINLRDALQQEIDNYALSALEAEAGKLAEDAV